MSDTSADSAVIGSAIVVGGIYAYRHFTEGDTQPSSSSTPARAAGLGPPLTLSGFLVAWGFVFLMVGIMAEASPRVGRNAAILVAVGDILTNGTSIIADVTAHATAPAQGSAAATAAESGVTPPAGAATNTTNPGKPGFQFPAGTHIGVS